MEGLDEYNKLLGKRIRELVPIQTTWAIAKEVNWENKTMTATNIVDGLDYFEVILGMGSIDLKPKTGTKCLIGIINNSSHAFLIQASELEIIDLKVEDSKVTISPDGIVIKKGNESMITVLSEMIDEINKIIVVNGTSINVEAMTGIKQRLNTILKV